MIGFLRAIQGLQNESFLPIEAPDTIPEIDPSQLLYYGGSAGGTNAVPFLPFAPELTAAVALVGGGRLVETLINSDTPERFLGSLFGVLPDARPGTVYAALALAQNGFDRQDPIYLARHLYRDPPTVAGRPPPVPPSLLWIEALGDTLTPSSVSRASALALGIPQVGPVLGAWPFLPQVGAPVRSNLGPGLTAGHSQLDTQATPSCVAAGISDGHFCAFFASEAHAQVVHFFRTALAGEAEIVDPLR